MAVVAAATALVGAVGVVAAVTSDEERAKPPGAVALTTAPTSPPTSEPPPTPPESARLAASLDRVWGRTPDGCAVVLRGGMPVYERNGERLVAPASAVKVLTAAAAVDVLGEATRFRTVVRATAAPVDGVVSGDLWLVGGGDPVLGTAAWARATGQEPLFTSLDALADRLVAAGVRVVEGNVVGDASRFDAQRYVVSWPQRLIDDGESGSLSALTVNDGFRVWGHPGVPFSDPPRDAAAALASLLRARGVDVGGHAAGRASSGAVEVAAAESPTVSELVADMLRESDNGTAELLVKEMGVRAHGEGTTAAGLRVVRAALERRGVPLGASSIGDGSGLSDANRVTCRVLAAAVATAPDEVRTGLAVAGRDGTLRTRLIGTPAEGTVRAKTGSLEGVAALAGVAQNLRGAALSFAFVVNGLAHGANARAAQDAFVISLASDDSVP